MINIKKVFQKSRVAIDDSHAAVSDLREQIAAIKLRIEEIERAPQNLEATMAAFDEWVGRIGTNAVDVLRLELATEVGWSGPALPVNITRNENFVARDSTAATEVLFGLIALTSREALRKIVLEQVADRMGGELGLSTDERAKALADARADLLAAELAEESLVRIMENAGLSIMRRGDVPGAVLLAHASVLPS